MLVRDLVYETRTLYKNGVFYQFKDSLCELPDKLACELVQLGEYSLEDRRYGYNKESWTKNRKLIFDTAIDYESGYGKAGVMLTQGLKDLTDLYVFNNGWKNSNLNGVPQDTLDLINKDIDIVDTFYINFWAAHMFHPLAQRQIGWTMFETTRIPTSWKGYLDSCCERVIVPCEANKKAFEDSGITLPIHVIPLAINIDDYPLRKEIPEDGEFVFGVEGTLTYRKGTDVTIEAFKKAFPKEQYPLVRLFIKTREMKGMPFGRKLSIENGTMTIDDDQRIAVVTEKWEHQKLIDEFYNKIDCYVSLSRGEGFGMPTAQAMCMGIPTIGSDCSGLQDQINSKTGFLVSTTLVDVPNGISWISGGLKDLGDAKGGGVGYPPELTAPDQQWWEPNLDSAIETMKFVYDNPKERKKRARAGAKFVRKNYEKTVIAKQLINLLDQIA